ncbi:Uncharacterized protein C3orf67 homolog [Mytilus coruscus]|uniref:Uncharacterized protein C3orf67 homolog n=1 Tax=Mytilus coruscus TaxID=42192 RepID=A0A6J8B757_MYTCO|nr:Uncharacterized protein C3orf67 homolog [Mytilus coruscus]
MYKNEYQGGPYFEVLTPQGKDSLANWKYPSNGFKKEYEKEVKSYVFYIEGTPATTKIQIPKDPKQSLTLIQRYLILQLFVGKGQDFLIELGVTDLGNNKRRLFLSTTQKETQVAASLHARVPLTIMKKHKWLNLCIDMVSMVGEIWRGQTYKAIESITVSANCKIRRIFTMKTQPPDTAGDEELYGCPSSNSGEIDQIPKQFQIAPDVDQVTQLLNITKIKHAERLKSGGDVSRSSTLDLDLSGRRSSFTDTSRYHIAFGTKVAVNPTSARKQKEPGNNTSRGYRNTQSRIDGTHSRVEDGYGGVQDLSASITSKDGLMTEATNQVYSAGSVRHDHNKSVLHQRQHSDPLTKESLEMISRIEIDRQDKMIVQPHPPREPSSDRHKRRRIRVKNGPTNSNKDRVNSAGSLKDENQNSSPQTKSPPEASRVLSHLSPNRPRRTSSESESLNSGSPNDSGVESRPSFTSKAEDIYTRKSGEYNVRNYQGDGRDMDESVSNVIAMLNREDVLDIHGGNSAESDIEDEGGGEYEESDDEIEEENNEMFLFVSKPKSAPKRRLSPNNIVDNDSDLSKTNTVSTAKGHKRGNRATLSRGPKPEDDFYNGNQSSSDENDNKLRKKLPGSRPASGSNSRPHSGSNSRPHSGTSLGRPSSGTSLSRPGSGTSGGRPQSGTVVHRPNSGTSSAGASPQTSSDKRISKNKTEKKISKNIASKKGSTTDTGFSEISVGSKTSKDTKLNLKPLQNGPKKASGSPELSASQLQDPVEATLTNRSISRMSRKSLREISQADVRKSLAKSSEKPYDFAKYQIAEITDSFEARMFESMKRQNEDAMEDVVPSPRKTNSVSPAKGPTINIPIQGDCPTLGNGVLYDLSPHATSDEDSTWQAPPNNPHNFQDEMKGRLSTDTMSSNPRDWSGVFSPPIILPHELANSTEDFSISSTSPTKDQITGRPQDTDNEEELDLMYDPCLNCYYDPNTCKYYELI